MTALYVEQEKGASAAAYNLPIRWCKLLYYGLDALYLEHSQVQLYGCLIAQGARSALRLHNARASLVQTTVYSVLPELQLRRGPLIRLERPEMSDRNTLLVQNSIVWGDREEEIALTRVDSDAGNVLFTHSILPLSDSDMRMRIVGEGASNSAPRLTNPLGGDFKLQPQSPAVGLGQKGLAPLGGGRDMLGFPFEQPAVHGGVPNAGAYAN
ncbi:MAG: hypothetical protein CSA97_02200 [Bacteroidetes bacterium]|nr:MAG: hypothetical protein CSA97_02200 [Bacteroidota bacterium]